MYNHWLDTIGMTLYNLKSLDVGAAIQAGACAYMP